MIDIFDSSDLGSKLADTIAFALAPDVPREDARTHGGLWSDLRMITFEHRVRCGFYLQEDYTGNRMMTYNVWEAYRASKERQAQAFELTMKEWEGRWYNAKQAIRIGTNAMWARVGVKRKMPLSIRGVCTEVVWTYVDHLGGKYQKVLREISGRDAFDPMLQYAMTNNYRELWRRKEHDRWCKCYHCRRSG